jgi:hypothetical protein
MSIQVVITGFASDKHAKTFVDWFEGQGEQDCDIWFEDRGIESQLVDCKSTFTKGKLNRDDQGNWIMVLKPLTQE